MAGTEEAWFGKDCCSGSAGGPSSWRVLQRKSGEEGTIPSASAPFLEEISLFHTRDLLLQDRRRREMSHRKQLISLRCNTQLISLSRPQLAPAYRWPLPNPGGQHLVGGLPCTCLILNPHPCPILPTCPCSLVPGQSGT